MNRILLDSCKTAFAALLRRSEVVMLLAITLSTPINAATTQYTYDNLGRLTQVNQTGGASSQYQYDANGNVTSLALTNTTVLTLSSPLDVNVTTPGQSASLSFTAAAGQSLTLSLNGISSNPAGVPVTINVYNSGGTLVASTSGSPAATLNLANLVAGIYSVVIAPQTSATATMQISLATMVDSSNNADAPLPLWALVLLGSGLFGITSKLFSKRANAA